jgi:hypothetical protein
MLDVLQISIRPILQVSETATTVVRMPYTKAAVFAACAPGASPAQTPCDPGAIALDNEDGDLSAAVVVTPSSVSLEGPLGTRVQIKYSVTDNGLPRLSNHAYRIIEIVSPCGDSEYFCNGVCKKVQPFPTVCRGQALPMSTELCLKSSLKTMPSQVIWRVRICWSDGPLISRCAGNVCCC